MATSTATVPVFLCCLRLELSGGRGCPSRLSNLWPVLVRNR